MASMRLTGGALKPTTNLQRVYNESTAFIRAYTPPIVCLIHCENRLLFCYSTDCNVGSSAALKVWMLNELMKMQMIVLRDLKVRCAYSAVQLEF